MSYHSCKNLVELLISASHDILPAVVERLRTAIRINSVNPAYGSSSGEGEFQMFFAAELEKLGCRVDSWEPEANSLIEFYPKIRPFIQSRDFRGRPNVVAWFPTADISEGRHSHLILNSHADTVAPGEHWAWRFHPFGAAVADGRLHGLGVADAKGCLFAFLGALMMLRATRVILQRAVVLQSVVDEEFGGIGTLECVRRGYTATAALVGEPTSLKICPGSRGMMNLTMRVFGRKAHPGEGWRGRNAAHAAWRYVETLELLRRELDCTHMHPLWASLPIGHVWNLMAINSGPPSTSVPDSCELHYSVGAIGTESLAELREITEARIAQVTNSDAKLQERPPEIVWSEQFWESAVTNPNHAGVTTMVAAGADLHEHPVVQAFSAVTDGRYLTNAGIPAVNFGPGDVHCCHSAQEVLSIEDIRRAMLWLALFMMRYCGVASGPAG